MGIRQRLNRRRMLRAGVGVAAVAVTGAAHAAAAGPELRSTPRQTEGPFYPVRDQADKDIDLTRIDGHSERARGDVIAVGGRVLDAAGSPMTGALVEIWQANAWGRYLHERDPNPAPLDPNFQGWGQYVCKADGAYRFLTVKPGAYTVTAAWTRPPHIHFKVAKRGYFELTTQMYFPGHELNRVDRILQGLPVEEQRLLIAARKEPGQDSRGREVRYAFDIVLRAVG